MPKRYETEPWQDMREHDAFLQILRDEGVRSYLEIGAMYGCSLWRVAGLMPAGSSRIVAIDSMVDRPDAKQDLLECISSLNMMGHNAHFINGDSTDPITIGKASILGPFDALFIDGNHSPEYVMADWINYGPMARIVGFHDINWNNTWVSARGNTPPADGSTMGAPKVWNELKQKYRHKEFKFHPSNNYYGIGVLWRD